MTNISGSTFAHVTACCLTAPCHYLNQCWLIISDVFCKFPMNYSRTKFIKWLWKLAWSLPYFQAANEWSHQWRIMLQGSKYNFRFQKQTCHILVQAPIAKWTSWSVSPIWNAKIFECEIESLDTFPGKNICMFTWNCDLKAGVLKLNMNKRTE